jgi:hypothetical protein
MPKANIGETITLEADKVYVIVSQNPDEDVDFAVLDTLDYDKEDGQFLACVVRGMLEMAVQEPEEMLAIGVDAFFQDGVFSDEEAEENPNSPAALVAEAEVALGSDIGCIAVAPAQEPAH